MPQSRPSSDHIHELHVLDDGKPLAATIGSAGAKGHLNQPPRRGLVKGKRGFLTLLFHPLLQKADGMHLLASSR